MLSTLAKFDASFPFFSTLYEQGIKQVIVMLKVFQLTTAF